MMNYHYYIVIILIISGIIMPKLTSKIFTDYVILGKGKKFFYSVACTNALIPTMK